MTPEDEDTPEGEAFVAEHVWFHHFNGIPEEEPLDDE